MYGTGLLHEHTRTLLERNLLTLSISQQASLIQCCSCNPETDNLLLNGQHLLVSHIQIGQQ